MKLIKLCVVFVFVVLLYGQVAEVFAETTPKVPKTAAMPAVSSIPVKNVEYILPYPGILPDHPLYFLKSLRDSILESLIADPARKAEFYLLMADKHLGMVILLYDQSKGVLATQIAIKGETYMSKAEKALSDVKKSGKTVSNSTIDKMGKALVKHTEVLENLVSKTIAKNEQETFTKGLTMIKSIQTDLDSLK